MDDAPAGSVRPRTRHRTASRRTRRARLRAHTRELAIFGAILPKQSESDPHLFGLADYAVTVTGGQVLHSILEYRAPTTARNARGVAEAEEHAGVTPGSPPQRGERGGGGGGQDRLTEAEARQVLAGFWARMLAAVVADAAR